MNHNSPSFTLQKPSNNSQVMLLPEFMVLPLRGRQIPVTAGHDPIAGSERSHVQFMGYGAAGTGQDRFYLDPQLHHKNG